MTKRHFGRMIKYTNLYFVLMILLCVSLGCLGPSKSASKCEGIIRANGKTFNGKAANEKQAGLNACNKFCLETDSEFDGMYQMGNYMARSLEQNGMTVSS